MDPARSSTTTSAEVILTPLPLYHIFSLTANCLTFMTLGAENVLIPNPRDIPGFVKEMAKHKFTVMTGVNTLFNALVNNPEFAKLDFSTLRVTLGGGMAVQEAVAVKWKKVTGCTLIEAYGLTETSPAATINPVDIPAYNGSIGLPISSTEIDAARRRRQARAAGPAGRDLHPRPAGDGRLLAASRRDGQGDRQGRLVRDRRHRRDGREGLRQDRRPQEGHDPGLGLQRLPERDRGRSSRCTRACSSARPSACPTRSPARRCKLFVVKKDDALTADDVIKHCREHLTGYKCPREVEFRKDLPKSNVGKILRRELRDEAKKAA